MSSSSISPRLESKHRRKHTRPSSQTGLSFPLQFTLNAWGVTVALITGEFRRLFFPSPPTDDISSLVSSKLISQDDPPLSVTRQNVFARSHSPFSPISSMPREYAFPPLPNATCIQCDGCHLPPGPFIESVRAVAHQARLDSEELIRRVPEAQYVRLSRSKPPNSYAFGGLVNLPDGRRIGFQCKCPRSDGSCLTVADALRDLESRYGRLDAAIREPCLMIDGSDEVLSGEIPFGDFLVLQDALSNHRTAITFCLAALPARELRPEREAASAIEASDAARARDPPLRGPKPHPYDATLRHCDVPRRQFAIVLEYAAFRAPQGLPFVLEFSVRVGITKIGDVVVVEGDDASVQRLFGVPLVLADDLLSLPRYSRLVVRLARTAGQERSFVASGSVGVFDRYGCFGSGRTVLGLIAGIEMEPPHPVSDLDSGIAVAFRWPRFHAPVCYRMWQLKDKLHRRHPTDAPDAELKLVHPLQALSEAEVLTIQNLPFSTRFPHLLPWYLKSIDLTRIANLICLPDVLKLWQPPKTGGDVLALLNPQFLDPAVRQYAISHMSDWSDQKLQLYMLQLMQALQSEPEIDSPLCLFLLRRAFEEPKYFGLRFFWALRSVAHLPWMRKRIYGLTYLFCAFSQPDDRRRYLESLAFTGAQISLWKEFHPENGAPPTESLPELIEQRVKITPGFQLPVDPKILVRGYIASKCRFMDSKKKPLWAVYERAGTTRGDSPQTIALMLKIGDDITQDQLTLQLLRVMDTLWKRHDLDLQLRLYQALPTGDKEGYIEVVPDATTLTEMQKDFGGPGSETYVLNWLRKMNGHTIPSSIIENYYKSLAGYCVATYVLGIGDRHCSNMMMQPDGHFFHIDFGHFLGHFKQKKIAGFVFRREAETLYYSDSLEYVLTKYNELEEFKKLSYRALRCLRRNAPLLMYLLLSMLSTGIEELQTPEDVRFVVNALMLEEPDEKKVKKRWYEMLAQAKTSMRRWMNDQIHMRVH